MIDPGRTPTTLFDEFGHGGLTLLLFDGRASTAKGYATLVAAARAAEEMLGDDVRTVIVVRAAERPAALGWGGPVLLDADGDLHTQYGAAAEALYLVRPDDYVGFRSQPARSDKFVDYLRLVVASPATVV